jgi:hypothetical protein
MLTQSSDHRSLVWIALASFAEGINGELKKKKCLRPNLVPQVESVPRRRNFMPASTGYARIPQDDIDVSWGWLW